MKKLCLVALSALTVLSLAGCGKKSVEDTLKDNKLEVSCKDEACSIMPSDESYSFAYSIVDDKENLSFIKIDLATYSSIIYSLTNDYTFILNDDGSCIITKGKPSGDCGDDATEIAKDWKETYKTTLSDLEIEEKELLTFFKDQFNKAFK
ncbi:hypothetical protein ACWG0P_00015 [Amedibacillus sp. YH-ame6]